MSPAVMFLVLAIMVLGRVDTCDHVTRPLAHGSEVHPDPGLLLRTDVCRWWSGPRHTREHTVAPEMYQRGRCVCVQEAWMIGAFISFTL